MKEKKIYLTGKGCFFEGDQLSEDIREDLALMKCRALDEISRNFITACLIAMKGGRQIAARQMCPLFLGTEYGPVESIHDFDMCAVTNGALKVNPSRFPNTVLNSITCQAALKLSLGGMLFTVYNGRNSGIDAIGLLYRQLLDGPETEAVAGAADEITPLQKRMHANPSCRAAAAVFSMAVGGEDGGTNANSLACVTGYLSFADPDYRDNSRSSLLADSIRRLAEKSGKSFGCVHLTAQSPAESDYVKKALELSGFEGSVAVSDEDYMSATGMLQIMQRLQGVIKDESPLDAELFVSMDDGRVSLLSLLIPAS